MPDIEAIVREFIDDLESGRVVPPRTTHNKVKELGKRVDRLRADVDELKSGGRDES